jgi:hypothetical protein
MPTKSLQIRCRGVPYLVRVTKDGRRVTPSQEKAAMGNAFKYQKTTTVIEVT